MMVIDTIISGIHSLIGGSNTSIGDNLGFGLVPEGLAYPHGKYELVGDTALGAYKNIYAQSHSFLFSIWDNDADSASPQEVLDALVGMHDIDEGRLSGVLRPGNRLVTERRASEVVFRWLFVIEFRLSE